MSSQRDSSSLDKDGNSRNLKGGLGKSEHLIDLVVLQSGLHVSCSDCLTGNEQGPSD